jgi:hypothetical protein
MSWKKRVVAILLVAAAIAGGWLFLSARYSGQPPVWTTPSGATTWLANDKTQDEGRIVVRVGSVRDHGYRVGDVVPVEVVIVTAPGVKIDPGSLTIIAASDPNAGYSGYYYGGGPYGYGGYGAPSSPDFELVSRPQVKDFWSNGKHVWEFHILVRSWMVNDRQWFAAQVNYMDNHDGDSNWYQVTTPTVGFSLTHSAVKGDKFDPGDGRMRPAPMPPGVRLLSYSALAILLGLLAWLIFSWDPRLRLLLSRLSPEERAWRVFEAVWQDADKRGWQTAHYESIAAAVRRYLHIEALTLEQARKSDLPDKEVVVRVLSVLEDPLYKRDREIYGFQRKDLYDDLGRLVPRGKKGLR